MGVSEPVLCAPQRRTETFRAVSSEAARGPREELRNIDPNEDVRRAGQGYVPTKTRGGMIL